MKANLFVQNVSPLFFNSKIEVVHVLFRKTTLKSGNYKTISL